MADLFSGTAQQAPSYVKSTSETPKWMQDALYNQINTATTIANQPYQPYGYTDAAGNFVPGQRIAEPVADTLAGYENVRQSVGGWKPAMGKAMTGTEGLTGQNAGVTQGLGYMTEGADLTRGAVGQGSLTGVQGYLGQATGLNPLTAAQDYMGQSAGTTAQSLSERAMAYADPYMRAAARSGATYIPEYMNPYNEAVTSQIARLGARNLQENILPALSDQFIRSGTFGGTRMGEFGQRAARDTQEAILAQQAQALQSGYGQALSAAQAEAAKQAGLAGTAGQIAGADLSRILQGAGQYGTLGQAQTAAGQAQQQYGLSAAQAQQQAAAQDYARMLQASGQYGTLGQLAGQLTGQQQQALLQAGQLYGTTSAADINARLAQAGQMANIGQGYAGTSISEAQRQQSALQQLANMAGQQQQYSAADSAALMQIGAAQQAQEQAQLDQAYADFVEQRDYARNQADWLNNQIRGIAPSVPTTTTQTGVTTQFGASPLTQLAQGAALIAGLNRLGT